MIALLLMSCFQVGVMAVMACLNLVKLLVTDLTVVVDLSDLIPKREMMQSK